MRGDALCVETMVSFYFIAYRGRINMHCLYMCNGIFAVCFQSDNCCLTSTVRYDGYGHGVRTIRNPFINNYWVVYSRESLRAAILPDSDG